MAITLQEVKNLSDGLRQHNFMFVVPNVPGGDDGDILRLRVVGTSYPGFGSTMIERKMHGFTVKEAGEKTYPRTVQCEFIEGSGAPVLNLLRRWHRLQWDNVTGATAPSIVYKTKAILQIMDNQKKVTDEIIFNGVYIEDVPDVPLTADAQDQVKVSVTFSYDDWDHA